MLFSAARAQLIAEVIEPAVHDIVCDRFIDSTVAYQGAARGLGVELVESVNALVVGDHVPDLTLLLRIDPKWPPRARATAVTASRSRGSISSARSPPPTTTLPHATPSASSVDRRRPPRGRDRGRDQAVVEEREPVSSNRGRHDASARRSRSARRGRERAFSRLLARRPARSSGKAAAARALAAELLAEGVADPDDARRRALADPSPHPDLVWLRPRGTQHLVEDVRERVIGQVAYRPFESDRRVFVIEAADAMAEESQNALLKTLEEPPPFAHLILISAEPEALLETVRSRCREVSFARLGPDAVEDLLADGPRGTERTAAARLAGGDVTRARFLLSEEGQALREAAETVAAATRTGDLSGSPWAAIASAADAAAEAEAAAVRERYEQAEEEEAERSGPARRRAREAEESAKRASRRARTETLDLGLALARRLDARSGRGCRGRR